MKKIIGPGLFLLVGLVFVVLSIHIITSPKKDFNTTKGVITNIEERYDSSQEDTDYSVYIEYTVDGILYENASYPSYHTGMDVGDEVIVLYDPNDPEFIEAPGSEKVPIVTLIAGIITVGISIVMFFSK